MSEWLDELQETSRGTRAALHGIEAQLAALREEMRAGFARIDIRFAAVDTKFAEIKGETSAQFAAMDAKIEHEIASTQRWAITVWLASLGFVMAVVMGYMTWLVRGPR